ncbi:UDP-glucose flavonoid 3-O-glucosyltransferase 7 [Acorus gramineus]|uniref:Glycosyltransferase n=1 Tax=Acorus gramineus TaxID=55184 RepID=A0AAV9AZ67_ACOGR|nr:UDP-glucose flavonoid 3-O-glucosyltransferase 7 [Acorus gramineus]
MSTPREDQPLHIFFFPLMAPGHIIPMSSLAALFAARGVSSTLLTTPSNYLYLPHHPQIHHLPFPNQNNLTDAADSMRFFDSLEHLRDPFYHLLLLHRPDCVITDSFLPWTADVARRAGVPRLSFQTMGFFPLCLIESMNTGSTLTSSEQTVSIEGLPNTISMKHSQINPSAFRRDEFREFYDRVVAADDNSFGSIVNTFYELEPEYADHYRAVTKRKAWHVGPLNIGLGHSISDPSTRVLSWLDKRATGSVVYVCFGTLSRLTREQEREIRLGLADSGTPYIWVTSGSDEEPWSDEKGLIMRGWAAQGAILGHRAVGGFVTHCGWNSILEALTRAVPMVTWPMCADQFYNERLVVEVLGVGIAVGAEVWTMTAEERTVIGRGKVAEAVRRVMGGGDMAVGLRRRVREVAEMARRAVEKGGSSYGDLERLIGELWEVCRGDRRPMLAENFN